MTTPQFEIVEKVFSTDLKNEAAVDVIVEIDAAFSTSVKLSQEELKEKNEELFASKDRWNCQPNQSLF